MTFCHGVYAQLYVLGDRIIFYLCRDYSKQQVTKNDHFFLLKSITCNYTAVSITENDI